MKSVVVASSRAQGRICFAVSLRFADLAVVGVDHPQDKSPGLGKLQCSGGRKPSGRSKQASSKRSSPQEGGEQPAADAAWCL